MKAFTDLEQSKKLAEILPLESADLYYTKVGDIKMPTNGHFGYKKFFQEYTKNTPCWSLAALIEVIGVECRMEKTPLDQSGEFTYSIVDEYYNIRTYEEGNPIDACVEMIYKLKELNLL